MAAVDMAMQDGFTPVQAKSIARRQGIPARFLEQVLQSMKKAGVVSSVRGAQGGYVLSKKPSELSVAEVLEALDDSFPSRLGFNGPIPHLPHRAKPGLLLSKVWKRVYEAERQVLEAITINELADQQRALEQQRTLMYHI